MNKNVPIIPHPSSLIPYFMEPEIARRCPGCGASVRGGAFFCPQCGTPVKPEQARVAGSESKEVEKPNRRNTDGGRSAPIAPPASASNSTEFGAAHAPAREIIASAEAASKRHTKRHRRSSAREVVGEKIAPRMEKLRQASNVMLDEATYDPSLRFVLVAAAIFVLTLLLFLLHGLLG